MKVSTLNKEKKMELKNIQSNINHVQNKYGPFFVIASPSSSWYNITNITLQ